MQAECGVLWYGRGSVYRQQQKATASQPAFLVAGAGQLNPTSALADTWDGGCELIQRWYRQLLACLFEALNHGALHQLWVNWEALWRPLVLWWCHIALPMMLGSIDTVVSRCKCMLCHSLLPSSQHPPAHGSVPNACPSGELHFPHKLGVILLLWLLLIVAYQVLVVRSKVFPGGFGGLAWVDGTFAVSLQAVGVPT